jgi:hypothetical protein
MKKLLLLALGAVLVYRIGLAQDTNDDFSSVPSPKPPYVAHAAQKAAWTIDFTPSTSGTATAPVPSPSSPKPAPPKKELKEQVWTKSGVLMRCVNTWSDGSSTEDWVVGAVLLSQDVKDNGIHIYSPKIDPRYHDFGASDFGMLDWITSKDYDHVVKHGDDVCYLFTAKTVAATKASAESGPHNKTLAQINAPTTPTTVYISVQSGLPVEMDNGDGKYIYHYLPTPADELKLPEPFLAMWKAYRQH